MFTVDGLPFRKIVDYLIKYLSHPKIRRQKPYRATFTFWSLRTPFTGCCTLSWLTIGFRSVVVDPCFIHCHTTTQKILFIRVEQLQTALCIRTPTSYFADNHIDNQNYGRQVQLEYIARRRKPILRGNQIAADTTTLLTSYVTLQTSTWPISSSTTPHRRHPLRRRPHRCIFKLN